MAAGFLTPRDSPRQRCLAHELVIDPDPADSSTSRDAYGNVSSYFHVTRTPSAADGHQRTPSCEVDPPPAELVHRRAGRGAVGGGPPGRTERRLATEFTLDLQPARDHRRGAGLRRTEFHAGRPLIEVLARAHLADLSPTSPTGPGPRRCPPESTRFWPRGKGYARTSPGWRSPACAPMVLAASYVSGYLATDPPPGKERMVGVDATHAWASVWTRRGSSGWDWIPTNDQMVDERYIVVGFGRDYADVPPLRGIIYTDSESSVIDVVGRRRAVRRRGAACVTSLSQLWPALGVREFGVSVLRQRAGFLARRHGAAGHRPGRGSEHTGAVDAGDYQLCANLHLAECNWLVRMDPARQLCASCALTRTRPNDGDTEALAAFAEAREGQAAADRRAARTEAADRRTRRRIPATDWHSICCPARTRRCSPATTTASSHWIWPRATTSTASSCASRWTSRTAPCSDTSGTRSGTTTSTGWSAAQPSDLQRFRELFGDPDADYQAALDRHYSDGTPAGWEESFVSSYATMHPAEDWAETFAHYLHIRDTLDTAAGVRFRAGVGHASSERPLGPSGFDTIIDMWLPLSWALNMVNRSMGHDDLYPFVLPAAGAGQDAVHPSRHRRRGIKRGPEPGARCSIKASKS